MSTTDETNIASTYAGPASRYGNGAIFIICVVVIVSVLLYGAVDSGTLALLSLLTVLLVVYWISVSLRQRSLMISANPIQLPLIALFLLGMVQLVPFGSADPALPLKISTTLSLDPYATRFFLSRLFLCMIFFAAALTFLNSLAKLRTLAFVFIVFLTLLAFFSILQRVEIPGSIYGLRQPAQALPFGTFINRHHFAALMEMSLGLALGILFSGELKPNRWPFIGAAAVVMAIAIFLTGSRGGLIGLIASLVTIAILTAYGRRRGTSGNQTIAGISPKMILAAGGVFLILTIALVSFLGGADPLLRSTGLTSGAGDFSSGRTEFWRTAIKIFLDHPVIGVGLDSFGVAYSMYDTSSGLFRVEQAHNDYLQILADAGIFGFACIASFIFLFLKKGLQMVRTSTGFRRGAAIGAMAGCVAIMVHSFFDFPLRTPANAFVFLGLVAMCVVKFPEEQGRRHHRRKKA